VYRKMEVNGISAPAASASGSDFVFGCVSCEAKSTIVGIAINSFPTK
jgi:hypothetical protein